MPFRTGDAAMTRRTVIAKHTIPWKLESIIFPWSYGIDAMHHFYQTPHSGCVITGLGSFLLPVSPKMVPPVRR